MDGSILLLVCVFAGLACWWATEFKDLFGVTEQAPATQEKEKPSSSQITERRYYTDKYGDLILIENWDGSARIHFNNGHTTNLPCYQVALKKCRNRAVEEDE